MPIQQGYRQLDAEQLRKDHDNMQDWISFPVTPEQAWPYPKANPHVLSGRGRKKGSAKILIDNPVERPIEEQEA
ncbi:hypothetical protein QYM36_009344 [Artemia franciscana]|uniref:Uncharacterized protein n=1 Tax=Artemia franciscana TaxID=6661 RepID=A0AA88HTE8_ARTSF|nr:hypothetical protein QYM36_009344 [Artemia franciscana]